MSSHEMYLTLSAGSGKTKVYIILRIDVHPIVVVMHVRRVVTVVLFLGERDNGLGEGRDHQDIRNDARMG
jgi:hypothetical protein